MIPISMAKTGAPMIGNLAPSHKLASDITTQRINPGMSSIIL